MTREEYVRQWMGTEDEVLLEIRQSIASHGMPAISVLPEIGRLLQMLVAMSGARRVLEIGALGGYSGVCLARGLPQDGIVLSLELSAEYAGVARENVERAGVGDRIQYRIGPALDSLAELKTEGQSFDFIFIDADKPNYPNYLDWAVQLSRKGAVIAADNILLGDRVLDPDSLDESVAAMRLFHERLAVDERLDAVLLPILDGLAIARVR